MLNDFAGIKNVSGDKLKKKYGGRIYDFDKDETKVVPVDAALFFSTQSKYYSVEGQKGLNMKMLFKTIPLHEALKVAKEPENPSVAAAKAAAVLEEKHKGEIRAEILRALKEEGWTAPKGSERVSGK